MGLKLVKVRRKDVDGLRDSGKPTGTHQWHPGKGNSHESKEVMIRERASKNRDSEGLKF